LPPGRARFETAPDATGSPIAPITMGIVLVARFAVSAASVPQENDVNFQGHQVLSQLTEPLVAPLRIPRLE
jgi:uncharacterized protein YggT (Ycf19 family)